METSEVTDISLNVLAVARTKEALELVAAALRPHAGMRVQTRLVGNGNTDPLHGVAGLPDVLILHLGDASSPELEALAARAADRRPALIAIGSSGDPAVMRLAMQAGARDLLPVPLVAGDLSAALERIGLERTAGGAHQDGSVAAFINAKGGCGATLLACNVAHMLAALANRKVCLIDLDLQFGEIPLYFDLAPKRGVLQALENVEGLDSVAFDAYLAKHASGLRILGHAAGDEVHLQTATAAQVEQLLALAASTHEHVVVDLPRRIDAVTAAVIARASRIVMVVQQCVTTLRDASRLVNCLRREFAVDKDRIVTVVNRYDKSGVITAADIRTALGCNDLVFIPNDFRTVSECIDTGTPLLEHARGAAITRAVIALSNRLGGEVIAAPPGLLARALAGITKQRFQ